MARQRFHVLIVLAISIVLMASIVWAEDFALKGEHDQVKADHETTKGRMRTVEERITLLETAVADLQTAVASLQAGLGGLPADVAALQTQVDDLDVATGNLQILNGYLTVDETSEINGVAAPHVILEGVNVHLRSGSGSTNDGGALSGLGNLIIGYNEVPGATDPLLPGDRGGSHNLVIGLQHRYLSYGGLAAGYHSTVSGPTASVSGGSWNTASGDAASVGGGALNVSEGPRCSIAGGYSNYASVQYSSILGGWENQAHGDASVVCGGKSNTIQFSATNPSRQGVIIGGLGNTIPPGSLQSIAP